MKFIKASVEQIGHITNPSDLIRLRIICSREVVHWLWDLPVKRVDLHCYYGTSEVTVVVPCWFSSQDKELLLGGYTSDFRTKDSAVNTWVNVMRDAEKDYAELLWRGWSQEEAVLILPNSLKTEVIATGDISEWRSFFSLKTSKTVNPQVREVAILALELLKSQIPVVFDDISVD